MTINGKTDDFTREDFKAVAQVAGLKHGRPESILSRGDEDGQRVAALCEELQVCSALSAIKSLEH